MISRTLKKNSIIEEHKNNINQSKINVTKIYMPDKQKFLKYVDKIYENEWVTNNGPLVQELQTRLAEYLEVKNLILVSSGTVALEIAYKLLKLKGDVVTTPFSFVATTASIVNVGLKPVFADIDPYTFNLDPKNIEDAITDKTSAIVPVHVFGNACEIEKIEKIASNNNLKVIYDAAHAFGVQYKDRSILQFGDISTLSFHATKLFHTVEGGALIIKDDVLAEEAALMINFGIDSPDSIKTLGTNAKMNEFEAAMGLCILDDIETITLQRKEIYEQYLKLLNLDIQLKNLDATSNYSYFPVLFKTEQQLLKVKKLLNSYDIYPRRYFYPSLDTLSYLTDKQTMKVSRDIANRILALPIYPFMDENSVAKIADVINSECQ